MLEVPHGFPDTERLAHVNAPINTPTRRCTIPSLNVYKRTY